MNRKLMLFLTTTLTALCVAQGAMAACPTSTANCVEPGRSSTPTCQFVSSSALPSSGNYGYIAPTASAPSAAAKERSSAAKTSTFACPAGVVNCPYGANACPYSNCTVTTANKSGYGASLTSNQTVSRYAQSGSCGTAVYYSQSGNSCTTPSYVQPGNCGTSSTFSARNVYSFGGSFGISAPFAR